MFYRELGQLCQRLLTFILIIFSGINYSSSSYLGQDEAQREQRQAPCRAPPPNANEDCIIVCNGETEFQLADGCWCEYCMPGTYRVSPCKCTADGTLTAQTNCMFAENGYMPVTNYCDKLYACTECRGDLIRSPNSKCGGAADNIKCICPDGQHQTGLTTCEDIPLCPKDYQSQHEPVPGSRYDKYICTPCDEGYEQPINGSLNKCQLIKKPDDDNPRPKSDDKSTPAQVHTSKPANPAEKTDGENCTCICPPLEQKEIHTTPEVPPEVPPKPNDDARNKSSPTKEKDEIVSNECHCRLFIGLTIGLGIAVIILFTIFVVPRILLLFFDRDTMYHLLPYWGIYNTLERAVPCNPQQMQVVSEQDNRINDGQVTDFPGETGLPGDQSPRRQQHVAPQVTRAGSSKRTNRPQHSKVVYHGGQAHIETCSPNVNDGYMANSIDALEDLPAGPSTKPTNNNRIASEAALDENLYSEKGTRRRLKSSGSSSSSSTNSL